MPRNMSFALTTQQIIDESKTVTRRIGWWNVRSGEVVCAVEKGMGLKKGEHINRLKHLVIESSRAEPLNTVDQYECILEGFPQLTPVQFVKMFCDHNKCAPDTRVNRIAFRYLIDIDYECVHHAGSLYYCFEPLDVDAPQDARPYCCYINTVVFYDPDAAWRRRIELCSTESKLGRVNIFNRPGPDIRHSNVLYKVLSGTVLWHHNRWYMRWLCKKS